MARHNNLSVHGNIGTLNKAALQAVGVKMLMPAACSSLAGKLDLLLSSTSSASTQLRTLDSD
eukprot:CAMPEP_0206421526 /NCGR_PEP_ID=MMETSP0324_2-20121206/1497_1 /ASSEMBLY_ACC=CAM_ASM_000836 /TAXON_ID=2866 /ORGANISM="Crypthecodinium cohnii, Strain Seligo" /LENGTH=61 /DNA_ID=CAMNT_0053885631 /DNA_START=137 /DNA_END=322 /DNA_ORIENTATION=+